MGIAAGVDQLSDGQRVYTWKHPWTESAVTYAVPGGQAYAAQHMGTIVVQVSSAGIVVSQRVVNLVIGMGKVYTTGVYTI